MEQILYTKYYHPQLCIGMVSWREAWLFTGEHPEKLYAEVHKARLVFRQRGTSFRISYQRLKKGLIKKSIPIKEQPLPF